MAFEGMIVEQVQQFGTKFQQQIQNCEQQLNQLQNEAMALEWKGPDRERMMQELQQLIRQSCQTFQMLEQKGQEMIQQAHQQDQASNA